MALWLSVKYNSNGIFFQVTYLRVNVTMNTLAQSLARKVGLSEGR